MSFPDVPDFLILHLFQNTGDYLEIRKSGMERGEDIGEREEVLSFELGEGNRYRNRNCSMWVE